MDGTVFTDRAEAGALLGEALARSSSRWAGSGEVVVLAIPRGGVEVAAVVARRLDAALDVVVPRKIGAPGNPELGLGAVLDDVEILDAGLIGALGVSREYLDQELSRQRQEIARRRTAYRRDRPPPDLVGKTAIVVDDGVATGGTAVAAVRWARARGASSVVLAVPVAPPEAIHRLRKEADEVVALAVPEPFHAVGQWYVEFPQVSDQRVIELLEATG